MYSDEQILNGIRQAAKVHGEPLTADRYDTFFAGNDLASTVRVIQRFGTWNAACAAAGLKVNPGRPSYRRRWSEEQMLEHVADYLRSEGSRGSYAGYAAYARVVRDAPSAQTVRNVFGGWANAKARAGSPTRRGPGRR